jgi:alkylation response protein AidB-like acyl-CoA dehydrogenase
MDAAIAAVQRHGGSGYSRGVRVERLFRDAKLTRIREGANELHRQAIGRAFREGRGPA